MKQVRFVPIEACQLQVREPQEGEQDSRTIVGMPIVYGVRSVNLTPWSEDREVYEVLESGFITPELLQRSDVILNLNHSTKVPDVLGRFRNSERDTLSLEMTAGGIKCRCSLPNTNNANDTLELMKRGDITGMSFAFTDDPYNRESVELVQANERSADGKKEVWLRRVKRATGFYDVAIVTHPAYEQTMVGTREFGEAILREIDEQIAAQRACDDEEKRKAEEEAKAEEERKAAEEKERLEREAEEARQLEEQEQRFREQQAMRMCAKARMLNEEILNSLEY